MKIICSRSGVGHAVRSSVSRLCDVDGYVDNGCAYKSVLIPA